MLRDTSLLKLFYCNWKLGNCLWWVDASSDMASHEYHHDLDSVVCPFMQDHADVVEFQHDNAMEWPSKSPDLSPIENLWDNLGQHVQARINPPKTVASFVLHDQNREERSLNITWEHYSTQGDNA